MKKTKETSKSSKIVWIITAVLALMAIVVLLIIFLPPKSNDEIPDTQSMDSKDTEAPAVALKTPYSVLKYPERWKDKIAVYESTLDGVLSETFCAVIEGKEYDLYTVYFGNSSRGNLFGYVPHDNSNIPVYIECYNIEDKSVMSENGLLLYYSMMESVNEVSRSISSTRGYIKP